VEPPKDEQGFVLITGRMTINKKHLVAKEPLQKPIIPVETTPSIQQEIKPIDPSKLQKMQDIAKRLPTSIYPSSVGGNAIEQQIINLVMQMGSDDKTLGQGRIDMRKFSHINELQQVALGHFKYRGEVDGIRYFNRFVTWILNSAASINGLRARQIIQIVAAHSGTPKPEFVSKPNILARNLWNKKWREEAEREGKVVVE